MTFSTHNETFNVHEKNGGLEIKDAGYWELTPGMKGRRISNEDVITADGVQRNIITINGMFPGPTMEVMQGAQVRDKIVIVLFLLFMYTASANFNYYCRDNDLSYIRGTGVPLCAHL